MDVKPLAWTPEYVARFWDYWSARPDHHAHYFTYQVGRGVCRFLQQVGPLEGRYVLDYGAGPGYLVEQLLRCGAYVSAVEYSEQCVADLNRRFRCDRFWESAELFDGRRLPWEDHRFDIVCCLETIEHLLPEHLNAVLRELLRVVRPGGIVLLTTPNAEDLRAQTVFCPQCCHEFHRWQHLRRWTPQSLEQRLTQLGYQVRFCRGLNFHEFQPRRMRPSDVVSWRCWRQWLGTAAAWTLDRWQGTEFPQRRQLQRRLAGRSQQHLVAVASKRVHDGAQQLTAQSLRAPLTPPAPREHAA
jgi:2-polyprenyl-3-methyl-5-hydroxy-6-metoxy-1,4-benzoquinol methylase